MAEVRFRDGLRVLVSEFGLLYVGGIYIFGVVGGWVVVNENCVVLRLFRFYSWML